MSTFFARSWDRLSLAKKEKKNEKKMIRKMSVTSSYVIVILLLVFKSAMRESKIS